MTTFRWELIFEVSSDGGTWTQLELPYKPGCINARPRWMPVGHFARLDWRLWFVPLSMGRGRWELPDWVEGFIVQLLRGSEPVAALTLQHKALMASPPRFVRVSVWDYHFSSCRDPMGVHRCSQVITTSAEHSAAYKPSNSCQPVLAGKGLHPSGCHDASVVQWGRWWYRRFIGGIGTYHVHLGQLHCFPESNKS